MKNVVRLGVIILFISSCGQFATLPSPTDAPEFTITVTENVIHTSQPTIASSPVQVEITPAVVSATGLAPDKLSKYLGSEYPSLPDELVPFQRTNA